MPSMLNPSTDLAGALLAPPSSDEAVYLLVDCCFCPAVRRIAGWPELPQRSLFAEWANPEADAVAPHLLAIDPERDACVVERIAHALDGRPALSVLHSRLALDQLAAHLTAYVVVLVDPDEQRFLLRFADTRVLPILVGGLDDTQRRQFLGPLRAWRYVGRDGRIATLAGGGDAAASGPLRLSAEQFASLVDASEADAILGTLRERAALPVGVAPAVTHQRALAALRRADERGVRQPADRTTWVSLALTSDAELPWDHEPFATAVHRALTGQIPLADALQECLDAA